MLAFLMTVGVGWAFHAAFAPQLDYAAVPSPANRPQFYQVTIKVRLASGAREELVTTAVAQRADRMCDNQARWCENNDWTFKLDGLKLTLLALAGDPVVGMQASATGIDEKGNRIWLPGPKVRWVWRTPPPKSTTTVLSPGPTGGGILGRAASGALAAAVTTVAAPELDFDALPDGKDRPQVYSIHVLPLLASGGYEDKPGCAFRLWGDKGTKEAMLLHCAERSSYNYDRQVSPSGLRVALLDYVRPADDGVVTRDRVVGLVVESNGPPPAVRWALRPEVRKLLKEK